MVHRAYLDMVFWMPWRCGLPEDFSDFAAVGVAAPEEAFPAPLDAPLATSFKVGGTAVSVIADGPGPPATDSPCPTAAMALILSLGRVLVEPME